MIISKLSGGLGNQMFQYSCGRRLSFMHKVTLILDKRSLESGIPKEDFTSRAFELDVFNLNHNGTGSSVFINFYKPGLLSKVLYRFNYPKVFVDQVGQINEAILKAPKNSYIDGYWQSEKYFSDITEIIRKDFTFPSVNENSYIAKLSAEIKSSNSVGIHFRRGDYASNKVINSVHGILDLSYYHQAVNLVLEKHQDASFFVFSDDPEWVRENFNIKADVTFIDHQQHVANYVDMKLMSYCKHNIIANSSYSWWGAWLNSNRERIVVAPKKWYAEGVSSEVLAYLLPKSWIVI